MLKGRGKTFAPKKVPVRKPGPAPIPVSSRQSADRQAQAQASTLLHSSSEGSLPAAESHATPAVTLDAAAQTATRPSDAIQSNTPIDLVSTATELKRKDRDADISGPATKRVAVELEDYAESQASGVSTIQQQPSGAESSSSVPSGLPNEATSPAHDEPRRQDRAPISLAPPVRPLSPGPSTAIVSPSTANNLPSDSAQHGAPATNHRAQQGSTPLPTASVKSRTLVQQAPESSVSDGDRDPSNPSNRYPSPENIVPVVDRIQNSSLLADSEQGVAADRGAGGSGVAGTAKVNQAGTSAKTTKKAASASKAKGKAPRKAAGKGTSTRKKAQIAHDVADGSVAANAPAKKTKRAPGTAKKSRKRRVEGGEKMQRKKREPKVRAVTPEGASDEEIDVTVMTMGDLTKDLKIGKRFSRYAEIKEMEEQKKREIAKAKLRKKNPELAAFVEGQPGNPSDSNTPAAQTGSAENAVPSDREPSPEQPHALISGPRMRLLNGRMVLDETSLTIDRHANAQHEREGMETVEENDFSRIITQGTYMKREPSQSWDPAANHLFYKGLRQFGTDFQMIAAMFPHRNRRQIKLKFNKEEKVNAAKINRILLNPKEPIDLEQYEKMSDMKLQPLEALAAEQEKFDAEQREEIAKFTEAAAEAMRKKKESIKGSEAARRMLADQSDDTDEGEGGAGGSNKENGGRGRRGKGNAKKGKGRGRGRNEDPGEIVGTIE